MTDTYIGLGWIAMITYLIWKTEVVGAAVKADVEKNCQTKW